MAKKKPEKATKAVIFVWLPSMRKFALLRKKNGYFLLKEVSQNLKFIDKPAFWVSLHGSSFMALGTFVREGRTTDR